MRARGGLRESGHASRSHGVDEGCLACAGTQRGNTRTHNCEAPKRGDACPTCLRDRQTPHAQPLARSQRSCLTVFCCSALICVVCPKARFDRMRSDYPALARFLYLPSWLYLCHADWMLPTLLAAGAVIGLGLVWSSLASRTGLFVMCSIYLSYANILNLRCAVRTTNIKHACTRLSCACSTLPATYPLDSDCLFLRVVSRLLLRGLVLLDSAWLCSVVCSHSLTICCSKWASSVCSSPR